MYVVVFSYRAKVGEEDALIALHEDWRRSQMLHEKKCLSWELLRNNESPRVFILIAHFASKELAQAVVNDLARDGWYPRLVSLLEEEPTSTDYIRECMAL